MTDLNHNNFIGLPGLAGDLYLAQRAHMAAHRHFEECQYALQSATEQIAETQQRLRNAEVELKAYLGVTSD